MKRPSWRGVTIRHLVFDLFGTLADSDPRLLCTPRGRLLAWGTTRWMGKDIPEEHFFEQYCEAVGGISEEELEESFHAMEQTLHFFDGVKGLLEGCKRRGLSLHLLSNTGKSVERFIQREKDTFSLFDTLALSYLTGRIKPDPDAFTGLLKSIGARPEECVMVGNSETEDIAPARELGMRTIHFQGRTQGITELKNALDDILSIHNP